MVWRGRLATPANNRNLFPPRCVRRAFGWSDPFPDDIGGGHDNHIYRVEACGDQTLFVQSDEVVDNPYAVNFVTRLLIMYQTFNAELKAVVEDQS